MRSGFILLFILLIPAALSAQPRDVPIPHCIAQYFQLNRGGPELLDVEIFEHPELGHTIKIKIAGRRNRSAQDLAYAFTSAAAVANLQGHIEMLWVEMEINFKDKEIIDALAQADCSIDALIMGSGISKAFWENCVEFP